LIAIIDYSAGNLRSVARALDFLKIKNCITHDARKIAQAKAIIFPGVGAAESAMNTLKKFQLIKVLQEHLVKNKPFLGICLGLQILFEHSEENNVDCLGFFRGKVKKLPLNSEIKIPHIGWNTVNFTKQPKILNGIKNSTPFYFVHSFFATPIDSKIVIAKTCHGKKFPTVIQQGNIWGTQFHPEKSGEAGLKVLENFVKM
jgi:imidazole glycerol-phosphate synthase subunit HisH